MSDFTLTKYKELLQAIYESKYQVFRVKDWIINPKESGIILRHDIDRFPVNALKMARLESDYNIVSTYYFRISNHTFKPQIIKSITELGHEIGYHYEDLSLAHGEKDYAKKLFEKHLMMIRKYAFVKTIAMHGRPFSNYDNLELCNYIDYSKYLLIGDAFLSIDYHDVYYYTDTGRSWSDKSVNLRDNVNTVKKNGVKSTNELIDFIKSDNKRKIAIVAHPERWNDDSLAWMGYYMWDHLINMLKLTISFTNKVF